MNKQQTAGEGRNLFGKGERAVGEALGSDRLKSGGVTDQLSGAVQHGFGKTREAAANIIGDAKDILSGTAGKARDIGQHGNEAIRDRLGRNGSAYLLAATFALLATGILGIFALSRR